MVVGRTLKSLLSLVWILIGLMTALPALIAAGMAFEAPGSVQNPFVWGVAACVIAFPVLCLFAGFLTFMKKSNWYYLLPGASVVAIAVLSLLNGLVCAGVPSC